MTISSARLTQPNRHVFLSPHYDDIALSCGGTAALLSLSGRTPEVALIFGDHPDPKQPMTAFAERMHRDWGLSASQVIAGRRAEEGVASQVLGTCDRFLPFRDAIYRGERYLSDEQLFGEIHSDELDIVGKIIDALRFNADRLDSVRIYAPLAIGGHVDHQHAFRAGIVLADQGRDVWFYEDLPYGLKPEHVATRAAVLAEHRLEAGPTVDVSSVWGRKIDAIMAYPSQLATIFEQYVGVGSSRAAIDQAMTTYALSVGDGAMAERFWSRHA